VGPGDGDDDEAPSPFKDWAPWCVIGAEVTLSATGEVAKVTGFGSGGDSACSVVLKASGAGRSVSAQDLQPIAPSRSDRARAFAGDYAGIAGTMNGVDDDGLGGILRVNAYDVYGETDYAVVQMVDVVKLAEW